MPSLNHSVSPSVSQSVSQSMSQSVSQRVTESASQSDSQRVPVYMSVCFVFMAACLGCLSVFHYVCLCTLRSLRLFASLVILIDLECFRNSYFASFDVKYIS